MLKLRTRLRELDAFNASVTAAGIELDRSSGLAKRNGRFLRLGDIEVKLLDLFLSNQGAIFTREQLVSLLWGADTGIDLKTVDQKIARLRKALTLGQTPNPIRSVRGQGYRFSETSEADYSRWLLTGHRSFAAPGGRPPGPDGNSPDGCALIDEMTAKE